MGAYLEDVVVSNKELAYTIETSQQTCGIRSDMQHSASFHAALQDKGDFI